MVRDGVIDRETIIRGPTTNGFWLPAARVPGVARLLGVCHGCGGIVGVDSPTCGRCGVPLSFEHNMLASGSDADDPSGVSAVELIKHAQYRHISRLQLVVRLQAVGLAVIGGALFMGLVAWLVGLLEPPPASESPRPSEIESVQVAPSGVDVPAAVGATVPARADDAPREPEVPLLDLDELRSGQSGVASPDPAEEDAKALRDQVIEELNRDITPRQASLIERLGSLLDRASTPDLPRSERFAAIDEALQAIDSGLEREQDEIMRYRLQALRGEFDEERRRLDLES